MNIFIRLALMKDCRHIFDIISDSDVIKARFKQNLILWSEHLKWFQSALKSSDRLLLILEDNDNNFLGMLRFDICSKHADVSIVLNKASRGLGYGQRALQMGCNFVYQLTGLNYFIAYVKATNIQSCKAFIKAGFTCHKISTIQGYESKIFTYKIHDSTVNTF
jgi:RimJ/RimL family protein N-acetyltransferase